MKKTIKFIFPLVVLEILLFYLAKQYTELTTLEIFIALIGLTSLVLFIFWIGIAIKILTRDLAYLSYKYRESESAFTFIGWLMSKLSSKFMALHIGYKILFVVIVCLYLPDIYNYFTEEKELTRAEMIEVIQKHQYLKKQKEKLLLASNVCNTPNKKTPSSSCREYILIRDNYSCNCCGSKTNLEIDHIFPSSKGGKTVKENLQVLCKYHNGRKYNKYPYYCN